MRFLRAALLTLLLPGLASAQALLEDGPYVLWNGPKAQVLRIHQGKLEQRELGPDQLLALDGLPPLRLDPAGPEPEAAIQAAPERIAAVSDIHGNYAGLTALLKVHGVMTPDRRWSFGKGHLVVIGDTFDRGSGVAETFWLLRSLEAQALAAGGRVHVLLGNHEVRALRGDATYLHPKYTGLRALTGLDQGGLYGPATEQGRWLRSRAVVMRLGGMLFVHAGLAPGLLGSKPSLAEINAQFRRDLDAPMASALLGRDGPSFYRGLMPGRAKVGNASDEEVTQLLAAYQAGVFVIGHTTLKQITTFHDGRVHGIDCDLQENKPGELWLWEQGQPYRGLADGTRVALPGWEPREPRKI
jgi:hypothetical protein